MATASMNKSRAAAATLGKIAARAIPHETEKLHGATFEAGRVPPADPGPVTPALDGNELLERKITELLDRIGQWLLADEATNFEKLTIARTCGPLLWDLKALVPHGSFKQALRDRFPKVNYAKCNRWMVLAKHEEEIQVALEKYPDVAWGLKKMIDFLKGFWTPEEEAEDDEDDCFGAVREDHVEEEPLLPPKAADAESIAEPDATSPFAVGALNPDLAAAVGDFAA